jgi:hypothetical protein
VLGGNELVLETAHLVEGCHQHGSQRGADRRLGDPDLLGTVLEGGMQARRHRLGRDLETAQERGHEALLLFEEREQEMLRLNCRMLKLLRRLLGSRQRFLGTLREPVQAHVRLIPPRGGG